MKQVAVKQKERGSERRAKQGRRKKKRSPQEAVSRHAPKDSSNANRSADTKQKQHMGTRKAYGWRTLLSNNKIDSKTLVSKVRAEFPTGIPSGTSHWEG
jgi:hypothetical protein